SLRALARGHGMSGEPLVEVRDLTKRFELRGGFSSRVVGEVQAVEKVSFAIGPHEVLGLAGESGSGKSTIGRLLLRLIDATSGQIRFMAEDITRLKPSRLLPFRRRAQIVFQDPFASLDPTMAVGDAIAEPLRLQGMRRGSSEL